MQMTKYLVIIAGAYKRLNLATELSLFPASHVPSASLCCSWFCANPLLGTQVSPFDLNSSMVVAVEWADHSLDGSPLKSFSLSQLLRAMSGFLPCPHPPLMPQLSQMCHF